MINDYWTRAEFPHDLVPGHRRRSASPACSTTARAVPAAAACSTAWSRWSWPASTRRCRRSWACTAGWRWARSTCAAPTSSGALAARDGADGADRRLRADRARRRLGDRRRAGHHAPAATATSGCSTARRSGSATPSFADLVVIWARDEDDEQVKGFVVEKGTEGMTFDKQQDKIALRVVQNAEIHLRRRTRARGEPAAERRARSATPPRCCR